MKVVDSRKLLAFEMRCYRRILKVKCVGKTKSVIRPSETELKDTIVW